MALETFDMYSLGVFNKARNKLGGAVIVCDLIMFCSGVGSFVLFVSSKIGWGILFAIITITLFSSIRAWKARLKYLNGVEKVAGYLNTNISIAETVVLVVLKEYSGNFPSRISPYNEEYETEIRTKLASLEPKIEHYICTLNSKHIYNY